MALKGNKLWKLRSTHGRDKIFGDPALLWEEACLYFDWCDKNPRLGVELVKHKGDWSEADVPLGRPYSIDGLTVYLGVSGAYFRAAKINLKEKIETKKATAVEVELYECILRIESVTRMEQLEGAAVGQYNASLMAKINGIADNMNVNNSGEAVIRVTVRDQQTADDLDEIESLL